MPEKFAIIVGSGFDAFAGEGEGETIATRFGLPSAAIKTMTLGRHTVFVLERHGDPHVLPPHAINYRANLAALASLGATSVIALNTVGVITTIRQPGEIAVPDQLIDYTWGREHSIHEGGEPFEHVDFTEPFSSELCLGLHKAATAAGVDCFDGGIYAVTQGPRLETAAEVDKLERDGADFIGMTVMPEAAIARELELEYACIALVVNYAAGRGDLPIHADIESSTLLARMLAIKVLRQFFS